MGFSLLFQFPEICMMRFTNGEERKSMSVLVTFFFFPASNSRIYKKSPEANSVQRVTSKNTRIKIG